jgi:predicted O-methyltransferase YrrM
MSDQRLDALARLVGRLSPVCTEVLEVGSYEGRSALMISNTIGNRGTGSVLCIDPWRPYLSGEPDMKQNVMQMEQDLSSGEVFQRFLSNIEHAHQKAPIKYLKGTLDTVYIDISKRKFDMVFIDGCHHYQEVRLDISLARSLVRVGGILSGDDLEKQGQKIYDEVKGETQRDTFKGCHPGVTCAVWENFGEVFCDQGIWAVKRTIDGWERLQ